MIHKAKQTVKGATTNFVPVPCEMCDMCLKPPTSRRSHNAEGQFQGRCIMASLREDIASAMKDALKAKDQAALATMPISAALPIVTSRPEATAITMDRG